MVPTVFFAQPTHHPGAVAKHQLFFSSIRIGPFEDSELTFENFYLAVDGFCLD